MGPFPCELSTVCDIGTGMLTRTHKSRCGYLETVTIVLMKLGKWLLGNPISEVTVAIPVVAIPIICVSLCEAYLQKQKQLHKYLQN